MTEHMQNRRATALTGLCSGFLLILAGCGGGSNGGSGGSPNPVAPTLRTVLTVTSITAKGERMSTGYRYEINFEVRESGGLGATVTAVDIDFFKGSTPTGTVNFESPLNATNRVNANGTAISKRLLVTDDRADAEFDTRIQARISYRDDNQQAGSVTASADIPPLPAPPPTTSLRLTGTVKSGSSALSNAFVEVRSGANAGKSVRTDSAGRYTLSNLSAGSMTVRASRTGYNASQRTISFTANATLNFDLTRTSDGGGGGGGGTQNLTCNGASVPSVVNCPNNQGRQAPTAQCKDGTFSCSKNRSGTCSSHGGVKCWVCPGPLCTSGSSIESEDDSLPWILPMGSAWEPGEDVLVAPKQ